MPKQFFWKDLSGRGYTNIFTLTHVKKLSANADKDYYGKSLSTWAKAAEVGDEWTGRTDFFIRIK